MTDEPVETAGGQPGPAAEPDPAEIEARVRAHLKELGIDAEEVPIDPAYAATADFCERYGEPPETSANCIVVAGRSQERPHVACLVQATRRLDVNSTVRRWLGVRKASFAPADETMALTGMLPDGVTPFGLPDTITVLVDPPILDLPRVVVGGGSRRLKLAVAPVDLLRLPHAEVIEGLSR